VVHLGPGDTVLLAQTQAPAHGEEQAPAEGGGQEVQHLPALPGGGQEGRPGEARGVVGLAGVGVLLPLYACRDGIGDGYGAGPVMTRQTGACGHPGHGAAPGLGARPGAVLGLALGALEAQGTCTALQHQLPGTVLVQGVPLHRAPWKYALPMCTLCEEAEV